MKYHRPHRGLLAVFLVFLISTTGIAEQYQGTVKFGGVAVPGAVVTASQADKKMMVVTDDQGVYTFPDLAAGAWTVEVEMSGFSKMKQEVTIAAGMASSVWDLKMLPMTEMAAVAAAPVPAPASGETRPAQPPAAVANGNRSAAPAARANSTN